MRRKWRSRNKDSELEKNNRKSSQKKTYRVYLVEPLDYFGVRKMQKTYQQQRLLAQQMMGDDLPQFAGIGTEPARPCKEDDLRILRRSVRPPSQNYEKRPGSNNNINNNVLLALEAERTSRNRTAVSIPLKEYIASRIKSLYNDLIRRRQGNRDPPRTIVNIDSHPLMTSSPSESFGSRRSSLSSRRTRTITESSTETIESDVFNYISMRKQVHFGRDTIYSDYSGSSSWSTSDDERELSWYNMAERRRRRLQKKAEKEENERPKPLLPFLESGLTYRNEEEFYRLKDIDAHKNPELAQAIQKQVSNLHSLKFSSLLKKPFSCFSLPLQDKTNL